MSEIEASATTTNEPTTTTTTEQPTATETSTDTQPQHQQPQEETKSEPTTTTPATFSFLSSTPTTTYTPTTTTTTPGATPFLASRNLYVNHIPPLSEAAFTQLFEPYGVIERIRLFAAPGTMGYGFVMYARTEDAVKALQTLNGFRIGTHQLHVSYKTESKKAATPVIPVTQGGSSNVYIANIPLHWTKLELDECCGIFGRIVESRVLMNLTTNTSRGVAFVRFSKVDEAALCITSLHGITLHGATSAVIAKIATDNKSNAAATTTTTTTTPGTYKYSSLVTPSTTTARTTTTPSSGYGPARNMSTNNTYRYNPMAATSSYTAAASVPAPIPYSPYSTATTPAYTPYATASSIAAAYTPFGGYTPTPPPPPTPPAPTTAYPGVGGGTPGIPTSAEVPALVTGEEGVALFVFHLPPSVTETELTQLFSLYGPLTKVHVMRDLNTGVSKGYGFVNMQRRQDAEQAVSYLNGFTLGNKHISVSFKK